jgi:hypothetical protein
VDSDGTVSAVFTNLNLRLTTSEPTYTVLGFYQFSKFWTLSCVPIDKSVCIHLDTIS